MNVNYPIDLVPATPEYVLELFREIFREWEQPVEFLSFDTTVSEFAEDWNDTILFWWELARSLNQFMGLGLEIEEWKPVLHPMRNRTLREACEFIAREMRTRPAIRAWHHIGGDCLPAGAFLTTRSILTRYGANPNEITPSTTLEPYLRRYGFDWVWELQRLEPGRLPNLFADRFLPWLGFLLSFSLGGGLGIYGVVLGKDGFLFQAFGCLLGGAPFVLFAIRPSLFKRIDVGTLHTFRDLAYALAGQEPRRRIQPSA